MVFLVVLVFTRAVGSGAEPKLAVVKTGWGIEEGGAGEGILGIVRDPDGGGWEELGSGGGGLGNKLGRLEKGAEECEGKWRLTWGI